MRSRILFSALAIAMGLLSNSTKSMHSSTITNMFGCSQLTETQKQLLQMGNIYKDEPPKDGKIPLDAEHVMNDYWKNISTQSQDVKDAALKVMLELGFNDSDYHMARYHYAAAVLAGANPNITGIYEHKTALAEAAIKQDYLLCKLLLEHGANPNTKSATSIGRDTTPAIFSCKTCKLAQLFLQHGARLDNYEESLTPLYHCMCPSYESKLIRLYKSNSVSPFYIRPDGATPLHILSRFLSMHETHRIYKKVFALLADLSYEGAIRIITAKSCAKTTVLEDIQKINHPNATVLRICLQSYLDMYKLDDSILKEDETCVICMEIMQTRAFKLSCGHDQFCAACITQWEKRSQTCPICRSTI